MKTIKYKGGDFSAVGFTKAKADLYLAEAEARKHRTQKEFGEGVMRDEQERDLKLKSKSKKSDKDKK